MKSIDAFNKVAISSSEGTLSYEELIKYSKYINEHVSLSKGEKVIIFVENRIEFIPVFFSSWNKRAINVCLDATFTSDELVYYLDDSKGKYIFASNKTYDTALEGVSKSSNNLEVINIDKLLEDKVAIDNFFVDPSQNFLLTPKKEDDSLILYTSGTTGNPKGVLLTFDNILVNLEGLNEYSIFTSEDNTLALLPMHHIFPLLGACIIPLMKGGHVVILNDLTRDGIISTLKKYKISIIIGVPRLYEGFHQGIMKKINSSFITRTLFKLCEKVNSLSFSQLIFKKVSEGFGGNMKYFVSGGSKLPMEIARDFYTLGLKVLEGYGMTETAPMIAFTPGDKIVPGSPGKILKGCNVKIKDDGEIVVSGRNVMRGYYNKEKETNEVLKDNYLSTGDLGYIKDGFLYITGRKKEMIVLSNGKNINPVEIEGYISKEEEVEEVGVLEYNKLLTALIVPNLATLNGKVDTSNREALISFFKDGVISKYNEKTPSYKKILKVEISLDELPKTKIGKIRRFLLEDLIGEDLKKKETTPEKVDETLPYFKEYSVIKDYLLGTGKKATLHSTFELDLGLDSLEVIELLSFVEKKFNVSIAEEKATTLVDLDSLCKYIHENSNGEISDDLDSEINWGDILGEGDFSKENFPVSNSIGILIRYLLKIPFKFFMKVDVINKSKIPNGPFILAGNHQSFADGFIVNEAIGSSIMRRTYYLAKIKHFQKKHMAFLGNHANIITIDSKKDISHALNKVAYVLNQDNNLVIFPEGTRTLDGNMGTFKKTFAILGKELNIPIVPFRLTGVFEAFPPDRKFPKAGRVSIEFLDPIYPKDMSIPEIVEKCYNNIKNK